MSHDSKKQEQYTVDLEFSSSQSSFPKSNSDSVSSNSRDYKPVRIYVDGCWDVMHSGHYNAIRQAKSLGDILIVGVHTDDEIARHKRTPVMKNEERLEAVRACKWADEVVFDVPYVPTDELLDREDIRADYVAHGDDMPLAADGESCYKTVMHRLRIFKRTPGVSTTALIHRLLHATTTDEGKEKENEREREKEKEKEKRDQVQEEEMQSSWSQFLATSHRIAAFSNNRVPSKSDKIVYIDGVFDLFHIGHIAALKAAKNLGTFLYVGIHDDRNISKYKGEGWPIMNLQERTLNVLSCKYVDEVIIGCPWIITQDTINALNIQIVILAHNTMIIPEKKEVEIDLRYSTPKNLGILHEIKSECLLTTDHLIQRICDSHNQYLEQNERRVKKELRYLEEERNYVEEV